MKKTILLFFSCFLLVFYVSVIQGISQAITYNYPCTYFQDTDHFLKSRVVMQDLLVFSTDTSETYEKKILKQKVAEIPKALWGVSNYYLSEAYENGKVELTSAVKLKNYFWFIEVIQRNLFFENGNFFIKEEKSLSWTIFKNIFLCISSLICIFAVIIIFKFKSLIFRGGLWILMLICMLIFYISLSFTILGNDEVFKVFSLSTYIGLAIAIYLFRFLISKISVNEKKG